MPNISLLVHFWQKYFPNKENLFRDISYKAFDPRRIDENADFLTFFKSNDPVYVCLLYIDVCDFTTKSKNLKGDQISAFFHKYYDIVIPIIYQFGGEVEKIIGDGLIVVFGQPFVSAKRAELFLLANACAQELLQKTSGTEYSSKVAFHCGEVNYFINQSGYYHEFSMVGQPLTELFRLESVAENESITYFERTVVSGFYNYILTRGGSYGVEDGGIYVDSDGRNLHASKKDPGVLKGVEHYQSIVSLSLNNQ